MRCDVIRGVILQRRFGPANAHGGGVYALRIATKSGVVFHQEAYDEDEKNI